MYLEVDIYSLMGEKMILPKPIFFVKFFAFWYYVVEQFDGIFFFHEKINYFIIIVAAGYFM